MKQYTIIKHVKAAPMTLREKARAERTELSEAQLREADTPGYLIEWEPGCRTWLPKDNLKSRLVCVDSFKDRLSAEREEVAERLDKLSTAMQEPLFRVKVGEEQFSLLQEQKAAMVAYISVLNRRLHLLSIEEGRENA